MWGPTEQEIADFYRGAKRTAIVVACGLLLIGVGVGIIVVKGCERYTITRVPAVEGAGQ